MTQTSTSPIVQTMMRSPLGNRSFGRSTIAEYFTRSLGNAIAHTTFEGPIAHEMRVLPAQKCKVKSVPDSFGPCQRRFTLEYVSRAVDGSIGKRDVGCYPDL